MLLSNYVELKKSEANEFAKVSHLGKEIEISGNYLLDFFDIDKSREIDSRCKEDAFVHSKRKTCLKHLKSCKKIHSSGFSSAIQTYNEILIHEELKKRIGVSAINDSSGVKNADYIISKTDRFEINADLKTILFNDANQNLVDYQKQKAVSGNELLNAKKGIFPVNNKFSPIVTS